MHRRQGALTRFKLPAEIVDHIIDDLAPYVPALRTCSLTCSEWRVRSQHHLLSSIYIPDTTQMASLVTFGAMFPFRTEGIRRVRISISALCGDVVSDLLPLANTDTLTLSGATSGIHEELSLGGIPTIFPNISSLTIKDWPLYPGLLTRVLPQFPFLRTLDLHQGPKIDSNGYLIADDYSPPRNTQLPLENLSLNASNDDLCMWLAVRSWLDVTALLRFQLDLTGDAMVPNGLYDFLVQTLPTLHELVIRVERVQTYEDMLMGMTRRVVRTGPNLKTLSLSVGGQPVGPIWLEDCLRLARVLAHPMCTAVIIDILLVAPDRSLVWLFGWGGVARELAQAPVCCASLSIVIPKLIVDEHQERFVKVDQMLRAHGITIRGNNE